MTVRFHINKNGLPSLCRAKEGNCPLGGNDIHFKTAEEAQAYIDSKNAEEFGILGKTILTSKRHKIDRFQRIDDLVESIGSENVLSELSSLVNDNQKEEVNNFIIKTYKIDDISEDLSPQEKLTKLAACIDNEPVIYYISKRLKPNELHNKIDYIEDKFNVPLKENFDEYNDIMLENKLEHLKQVLEKRRSDESIVYLKSEIDAVQNELTLRGLTANKEEKKEKYVINFKDDNSSDDELQYGKSTC